MKLSAFISLILSMFLIFSVFMACFTWSGPKLPAMGDRYTSPRSMTTLVLDPGHGGADGGAVSITGTYESKINLEIALRAEQLAAFYGVIPVMTRTSEQLDYPNDATTIRAKKVADQKSRLALINGISNAALISIHQNIYATTGPSGSQVFFGPTDGSDKFGDAMQKLLMENVNAGNRSSASKIPETIFLMNAVNCPAILIECGFLSNPQEAALLEDETYQLKLATVITGGFLEYFSQQQTE